MRDPEAFEAFYRRHAERVSRFVARRVADPHTVDDLTTEVFLAVSRTLHLGLEPLSVADAATALRIRVGTARVRLHRARHRLVALVPVS